MKIRDSLKKGAARAMRQIARDVSAEIEKLELVEMGRLRKSIGHGRIREPSLAEWRRAHADSTVPPLIYVGPNDIKVET